MNEPRDTSVLLIYTDQLRYDAIGCAGNAEVLTPNIDRLAARGVRFDKCFVQHPLCMPSRLSFLTGRYPSSLRVTHMGVPVPEETETLPRMLGRFGYRTANLGKLHFLPHANRDHRRPHPAYGFEHAEISDEPGVYDDAYLAWVARYFPRELANVRQVANPPMRQVWAEAMGEHDALDRPAADADAYAPRPYPGDPAATHSAFVADRTLAYLDARARDANPYLCVASFYNPHSPLVAPADLLELYAGRDLKPPPFPPQWRGRRPSDEALVRAKVGYFAMISEVDRHVGRLLDRLDASGLSRDTLVVFTSDHGEFLGEHGRWGKSYPVPDCVSRVPLVVAGPGVATGATAEGIVEAVDVVPTILAALGKPVPPDLQGRPRLEVLRDPSTPTRAAALTEDAAWKALRTERHRYLIHADGREELYDLAEPLGEYHDVAADPARAADLAELRRRLLVKLHANERPLPRAWPY